MPFAIGLKLPGREWGLMYKERKTRGVLASHMSPVILRSEGSAKQIAKKWKGNHPHGKTKLLAADKSKAPFLRTHAEAAMYDLWADEAFSGFGPLKAFFKR